MRTRYLLSMLLALISSCVYAQASHRFATTIRKCSYTYVPPSVFDDSVEGVENTFDEFYDPMCEVSEVLFRWYSIEIDGAYNLVVTPRQIYLYSSHDNPNRSYLYWAISIDSIQYRNIFNGLNQAKRLSESNGSLYNRVVFKKSQDTQFPHWAKDGERSKALYNYCTIQRREHLERYFTIMNNCLPAGMKRIHLPSKKELDALPAKLTSKSTSELVDWLPKERKK